MNQLNLPECVRVQGRLPALPSWWLGMPRSAHGKQWLELVFLLSPSNASASAVNCARCQAAINSLSSGHAGSRAKLWLLQSQWVLRAEHLCVTLHLWDGNGFCCGSVWKWSQFSPTVCSGPWILSLQFPPPLSVGNSRGSSLSKAPEWTSYPWTCEVWSCCDFKGCLKQSLLELCKSLL